MSALRTHLTGLNLAERQSIGHLLKEATIWKGLDTYTLFMSVDTATHSVRTVIRLLSGPDQTFHRLHDLGHQGMWPRGNKVFLSASWV